MKVQLGPPFGAMSIDDPAVEKVAKCPAWENGKRVEIQRGFGRLHTT